MQAIQPQPRTLVLTCGAIARQLGVDRDRVHHILRTRRHIEPTAYAGRVRLYGREVLVLVKRELELIEAANTRRSA